MKTNGELYENLMRKVFCHINVQWITSIETGWQGDD